MTGDGGVVLLRQADRRLGLTERVAGVLSARRRRANCTHELRALLRQRVFGLALGGTARARAPCGTIRLQLLKIGAVVLRNTRRVRFLMSSGDPHHTLFFRVAARLSPDQTPPSAVPGTR